MCHKSNIIENLILTKCYSEIKRKLDFAAALELSLNQLIMQKNQRGTQGISEAYFITLQTIYWKITK